MNLAHGGRVVERVEVKRESPSSTPIEDWDDRPANNYLPEAENWDKEANESSYTIEGRNLAIPAYRTVRRVAWGERCAACGGRLLRCAVIPNRGILFQPTALFRATHFIQKE